MFMFSFSFFPSGSGLSKAILQESYSRERADCDSEIVVKIACEIGTTWEL